jgi:hypothetical protein
MFILCVHVLYCVFVYVLCTCVYVFGYMTQTYTNTIKNYTTTRFIVPWIDENINPYTGDWISRTMLKTWKNGTWDKEKGGEERGKDYNHSMLADLIISGLIGLRPRMEDDVLVVNPLVPGECLCACVCGLL